MIPTAELFQLPVAERLALVEDLWNSIAKDATELRISNELRDELRRRAKSYRDDPDSVVGWEQLDARLDKLRR
jgi:putative addiction module component (TIGR02574 family)